MLVDVFIGMQKDSILYNKEMLSEELKRGNNEFSSNFNLMDSYFWKDEKGIWISGNSDDAINYLKGFNFFKDFLLYVKRIIISLHENPCNNCRNRLGYCVFSKCSSYNEFVADLKQAMQFGFDEEFIDKLKRFINLSNERNMLLSDKFISLFKDIC